MNKPRVLVACEYSGIVREAFTKMGCDAWSCDLLDTDIPGQHYKGNIEDLIWLPNQWDLMIAHPPCTRLANSVWWYIVKNNLYHEVIAASILFNMLLDAPIKYICIENPIQNKEAKKHIRRQDQIIQPYNFGNNASKATCLWLKSLPLLKDTDYYLPRIVNGKKRWGNQTDGGWNKLAPSDDRAKLRSKTFPGIAAAMAEQWSPLLFQHEAKLI